MGIIRKNYTDQFREEAVKLSENVGIAQAGKDLGTNSANISRWRKESQKAPHGYIVRLPRQRGKWA